jgi:GDP-D-mannose dehydratase
LLHERGYQVHSVIATGESHTLEELTAAAFAHFHLDWHDHVDIDPYLFRASEITHSRGNPEKAKRLLHWEAKTKFAELVRVLANAERRGRGPRPGDKRTAFPARASSEHGKKRELALPTHIQSCPT